jgi:hypothetical protein
MISNERRWPAHIQSRPKPYGGMFQGERPSSERPPSSWAGTLESREVQIERKRFQAALKENASGRFLRITETSGDKSSTIIIPATGLRDFSKLLGEILEASDKIAPANGLSDSSQVGQAQAIGNPAQPA